MGSEARAFSQAVRGVRDLETLNALFRAELRPFGFSTYAVGQLSPPGGFFLLEWPRAWLELYAARGFSARDVAVEEALRSPAPFTWREIRARRPEASRDIFEAAASFGWLDGFVIPVHGAGTDRGIISLAAGALALEREHYAHVLAVSLAAYERARQLLNGGGAPAVTLSPREREALELVANGRSDAEIAARLAISPATAHFHVESAKRKLGARTRAHAVAIALTRGLIAS